MKRLSRSTRIVLSLFAAIALSITAHAQVITIERPGERDFIVDRADLITPEDEQRIRQICDKLLTDTASPIIVVTVESMARSTQRNISSIESFAKILFDQWGIGHLTVNGQPANTGILFLVSRDDRKMRIELGIGWDYEKEAATQRIMNDVVVPRFRAGDFSGGIVAGVQALDQMARQGPASITGGAAAPGAAVRSPSTPNTPGGGGGGGGVSLIGCGGFGIVGIIIVVFIIIRLLGGVLGGAGRRGLGGYGGYRRGPGFGTGLLGGMLLGNMMGGGRSSGSSWGGGGGGGWGGGGFGGGFSGGSFGGGFSGGHGASGSW